MPNKAWINQMKNAALDRLQRKGVPMSSNLSLDDHDWYKLEKDARVAMRDAKAEIFEIASTPCDVWPAHDEAVDAKLFAKAFVKAVKKFNKQEKLGEPRQREECQDAYLKKLRKKFEKNVVAYAEEEAYKYAAKAIYECAVQMRKFRSEAEIPIPVKTNEPVDNLNISDEADDLDISDGGEDPFLSFS